MTIAFGHNQGMNAAMLSQDLPEFATWLNAPPATLMHYQGRPLVVAFINAASAWSIQRLQELQQWQARNPGRLQVVVVQVPRFDFERDGERSLSLLRRAGVSAPVLLDAQWEAWQRFGVDSWPTLVFIDAYSREVGRMVGLGDALEPALASLCQGAVEARGGLDMLAERRDPQRQLHGPAGLVVTEDRLYIADSGHHRVLECNHAGRVLRQFGMGTADMADGEQEVAAFNRPQGLALGRGQLYVADSGNHALRRINLLSGQVDTLIGTGKAADPVEGVLSQAWDSALNHPRAVAIAGNQLMLAMAGDNRIWSYDLGSRTLSWRAGSGALDLRDGGGHLAAFAQPVGLAVVQNTLYVCDALSSSVRSMQLRGNLVQTVVGQGMWEHGLADGPRDKALLQFPQALAMAPDSPYLWISDAGNGCLRRLRLGGGQLDTVTLPRKLNGAAGLAVAGGVVWIADTEGHAVLRYDPATGSLAEVPIGQ